MNTIARLFSVGFFLFALGAASGANAMAEEYYIYRDAKGGLVLSNQKPPAGSTIIKQITISEQRTDESPTKPPQAQVRPQAESKVEERPLNVPADDLAPRLNWVWNWSI